MSLLRQHSPYLAVLLLVVMVYLSACAISPVDLLNKSLSDRHYTRQTLAYGELPRQQLDVYRPKVDQGKVPIVFIYGGAWRSGEKRDYKFVGHALTQLGHPVIIPDYQLFPESTFPVFIEDVAQAIKAVERNAGRLIGEPMNRFVLMGHSAGAHSAALLFTDRQYLNDARVNSDVAGLIGLAGPYDLNVEDPEVKDIFANEAGRSQLIDYIIPNLAPTLLLHGESDTRVFVDHTQAFATALTQQGNSVETAIYPSVSHTMILGGIAQPLRGQNDSFKAISAFLTRLP